MNAALQRLADQQEIRDLIFTYCRSVDRLDSELGHSIWLESATADYGPLQYQGTGAAAIDWICDSHRQMDSHSHQVSNILIEVSGDRAASEAYVTATLRFQHQGAPRQITLWARYIDRWEKHAQQWGLAARTVALDHSELREVTSLPSFMPRGRRDTQDPSYAAFEWTKFNS